MVIKVMKNEGFTELPEGALKDSKGVIVKRDFIDSGRVSDKVLAEIRKFDIEQKKNKLRVDGKL